MAHSESQPTLPSARELARQPELAVLVSVDVSLALLVEGLTAVYEGQVGSHPARDQARSMVGVARAMRQQIAAYRAIASLPLRSQ